MAEYGNMDRALPGMAADVGGDQYRESGRTAEEPIKFGIAVFRGTTDKRLKKAALLADASKFMGITRLINNGIGYYDVTDPVTYFRKGRVHSPVSATGIAPGDSVYVDLADTDKRLTNDDNAGANPAIPAKFREAESNGIAVVEVNIP